MNLVKDEMVKREILTQAQDLFKQYGLKKTTMDEIAAACGKAKSTLYHYYKSKEEVFNSVIDMELKNLRIIIKEKVDAVKSIKEKIEMYLLIYHQEILKKINLYRIVKHEMVSLAYAQEQFSKVMNYEKSYITRILEDGYDVGEFTLIEKDEIPWFAEILLAAFFGIVGYSIEKNQNFDTKKMKSAIQLLLPKLFT